MVALGERTAARRETRVGERGAARQVSGGWADPKQPAMAERRGRNFIVMGMGGLAWTLERFEEEGREGRVGPYTALGLAVESGTRHQVVARQAMGRCGGTAPLGTETSLIPGRIQDMRFDDRIPRGGRSCCATLRGFATFGMIHHIGMEELVLGNCWLLGGWSLGVEEAGE